MPIFFVFVSCGNPRLKKKELKWIQKLKKEQQEWAFQPVFTYNNASTLWRHTWMPIDKCSSSLDTESVTSHEVEHK